MAVTETREQWCGGGEGGAGQERAPCQPPLLALLPGPLPRALPIFPRSQSALVGGGGWRWRGGIQAGARAALGRSHRENRPSHKCEKMALAGRPVCRPANFALARAEGGLAGSGAPVRGPARRFAA